MYHPQMLSDLSPNWQRLVRAMQLANFGSIGPFDLINGEPQVGHLPVSQGRQIGRGIAGPRRELGKRDLVLRQEIVTLIDEFRHLSEVRIRELRVTAGLPTYYLVDVSADLATVGS